MIAPAALKPWIGKIARYGAVIACFVAMAALGTYMTLTWIIQGEESVVVPDLVGKDVLYGLEILSDLGLNTRVRAADYHEQVPKNHVIAQDPPAGSSIKTGRDVKIRVSKGPQQIVMPNLIGLTLQQSRILLAENGLCQRNLTAMATADGFADQVLAQHPLPGITVLRSQCADLLLSRPRPPHTFAMPDLTTLPLETALQRIESLHLRTGTIGTTVTANAPPETIVRQTPLAGYRVAEGDTVTIMVNRSRTAGSMSRQALPGRLHLFRYPVDYGFLKRRVQVRIGDLHSPLTLYDDFVAPGQEIWLLIPKSDTPSVRVYVDGQLESAAAPVNRNVERKS